MHFVAQRRLYVITLVQDWLDRVDVDTENAVADTVGPLCSTSCQPIPPATAKRTQSLSFTPGRMSQRAKPPQTLIR